MHSGNVRQFAARDNCMRKVTNCDPDRGQKVTIGSAPSLPAAREGAQRLWVRAQKHGVDGLNMQLPAIVRGVKRKQSTKHRANVALLKFFLELSACGIRLPDELVGSARTLRWRAAIVVGAPGLFSNEI